MSSGPTPTVAQRTVIGAHSAAFAVAAGVMWMLHAADHNGLLTVALGVGVYAAVLGGTLSVATHRAEARDKRQRENFSAYIADRDRHLRGHE